MPARRALLPPLATLAALAAASPAAARSARPPQLPLAPCHLSAPGSADRLPARCGTLEVPEDWDRPGGRTLRLRVAVIAAEDPRGPADPVVLLAGGPGQAATEAYPAVAPAFARLRRDRDVVLLDQRGTGGSARLDCPELDAPGAGDLEGDAATARRVAACAAALSRRADLTRYGTDAFVRDLDRAREALGYDRLNLVGFSYGTRAALVYARTFPARVRTMVLDGVVPVDRVVGGDFEPDVERALDLMFRRCDADPGCHGAFPHLRSRVAALVADLARRPRKVAARHPRTGKPVELEIGAGEVRRVVVGFAYAGETTALVPVTLDAATRGDLAPLAGQALMFSEEVRSAISRPLQLCVLCSEDIPFLAPARAAAARAASRQPEPASFLGGPGEIAHAFRTACAAWPHVAVPASWKEPVRSDVPALLLSGGADPVTPPEWAERAARTLPNARSVVLDGQGHGVMFRGCLPRLAAEFVRAGTAAGLDLSCAARTQPAPFFVDLEGPTP